MPDTSLVARSPITPASPVTLEHGWEISARRSTAALRITDCTPLAKVLVRGPVEALRVPFGRAEREADGVLVVCSGPGEWLLLGPPGKASELMAAAPGGERVSVFDATHGRALMRLVGEPARGLLAKVCAINLTDAVTPNGSAFRTSVAKLVTDVVRDDRDGMRSYLLHCERSSGQYLFDALLDAGGEWDIEVDGLQTAPP